MATATPWAGRLDEAPRLIEVDGRTLCVQIRGSGPTVVLESAGTGQGIGGAWGRAVETGLTDIATALSYDRAGVGYSEGPQRRTIAEMADDLHRLIRTVGADLPVVIVSWSYGGLVAALHAVRHPEDVAGLVFVDPTPTAPAPMPRAVRVPLRLLGVAQLRVIAAASTVGLFHTPPGAYMIDRIAGEQATSEMRDLTARFYRTPRAINDLARMVARMDEHLREVNEALDQPDVRFPDVPTTVITAGVRPARMPAVHREHTDASHRRLASLAPRGRVVVADQETHQIPYEQPDIIVRHVTEMIEADPGGVR